MTARVIQHPGSKALTEGAKALREKARRYAFDAGLYAAGIHTGPGLKTAHTTHARLLRYAAELEALAGRRTLKGAVAHAESIAPK